MNLANKLSLQTSDYLATVNVDNKSVNEFSKLVKNVVAVNRFRKSFENVKFVDEARHLDESVFDKTLVGYSKGLDLLNVVRVTDNLGLVLVCGVPVGSLDFLKRSLYGMGIFETWTLEMEGETVVDLLFRVKKY